MRESGRISAEALRLGGSMVKAGITTSEINKAIHDYIISQNAYPSFLDYGGYPASACISVNEEVIHGIPGSRILVDGDIVSIDVGAYCGGFHGDNAATFVVGNVDEDVARLVRVTQECLCKAVEMVKPGARIGDISNAVQVHAESNGFFVVKDFVGHGVGADIHEDPQIPNYGRAGRGVRLIPGMTLAIEPMINLDGEEVEVLEDDWTVVAISGKPSAHFEHTVAVTEDGCEILTALYDR